MLGKFNFFSPMVGYLLYDQRAEKRPKGTLKGNTDKLKSQEKA